MAGVRHRVVVVDDDEHVRLLARTVLEQDGLDVVACASSYEAGLEAAAHTDVAVVDLRLRGRSGAELARELTERGVKVLVYTGARDREALRAALQSGAVGVALKAEPLKELPTAVRAVASGERYTSPALSGLLEKDSEGALTPREREVLFLLATGLNNEQVAEQLGLSSETTRTHLKRAMRKLGATTRVQAVAVAAAQGEIRLP